MSDVLTYLSFFIIPHTHILYIVARNNIFPILTNKEAKIARCMYTYIHARVCICIYVYKHVYECKYLSYIDTEEEARRGRGGEEKGGGGGGITPRQCIFLVCVYVYRSLLDTLAQNERDSHTTLPDPMNRVKICKGKPRL